MAEQNKTTNVAIRVDSKALSTINSMEDFDRIVSFVADSNTYNEGFKRNIEVEDEDGTKKMVRVVDKNAIATCLMLGSELGFKPIESILLGTRLDANAIVKVHRGRDLGVSAVSAMQNIYVFNSGDGRENVYTSIHIINKCLVDNHVTREILEDGSKVYSIYTDIKTGETVEPFDERLHFAVVNGVAPAALKAAADEGKLLVTRKNTRRALVKLTRHHKDGRVEVIAIPYTLQQAIDAGLYAGKKTDGSESKGKNNWNNHPETHLVKMSIMLGARILIGDALQGTYIPEELPDSIVTHDTTAEEIE